MSYHIIDTIIKGLIKGIFAGYLLTYGLRPAVAYPEFVLEPLEHKWLFIVLFIINYYIYLWDSDIAILMLLCIFALLFDMIVFTNNGIFKVNTTVMKSNFVDFNTEKPSYKKITIDDKKILKDKTSYNIMDELKKIKTVKHEFTSNPGDPSPFIL